MMYYVTRDRDQVWLKEKDILLFAKAVSKKVYPPTKEGLKLFIKHHVK